MRTESFHEPRDERGSWIWIAVGCGGLALSLLCIVPPALWLVLSRENADPVLADPVLADPVPTDPVPTVPFPPDPTSPALPSPALPSPALPSPALPSPAVPSPGGVPGGLPPPPSTGFTSPRRVTAVVEEVSGSIAARPGATCAFDVTRHEQPDGTFWCNAQVTCAGQLLYGGQGAGFFDCTLYEQPQRHVVGEDPNTTSGDRDAAMRLDTLRGVLTVRDDRTGRLGAFSLRARVTQVQ